METKETTKVKILAVGPPDNLNAAASGIDSVDLGWDAVAGATEYGVYRSDTQSGTYTKIDTATQPSYADTGLSPNSTYSYYVTATDADGESAPSSAVSATTNDLAAPTATATALTSSGIRIDWNAVANADGYIVYRSASAGGAFTQVGRVTAPATTYTDAGLTPQTAYYYRVAATTGAYAGPQSAVVTATTLRAAPAPPASITATAVNETQIHVNWSASADADGYRVYVALSPDGAYTRVADIVGTSYLDGGLTPDTTYYFKVEAYNTGGVSAQTGPASATTRAQPMPPTGLRATAQTESQIAVSWAAPAQSVDGYRIYRSDTANGVYALVATIEATRYVDTNLSPSTTYYYKVESYRGDVTSAQTGPASATTLPVPGPVPPSIVSRFYCVTLNWCACRCDECYAVTRREANQCCFERAGVSEPRFRDCSLIRGRTYYYKVFARRCGCWYKVADFTVSD